jgi:hypothetical protein
MKTPIQNKILTVILTAILIVAFSNASSALPHMDSADCGMKVSCNNCATQAVLRDTLKNEDVIVCNDYPVSSNTYDSFFAAPDTPPPKKLSLPFTPYNI